MRAHIIALPLGGCCPENRLRGPLSYYVQDMQPPSSKLPGQAPPLVPSASLEVTTATPLLVLGTRGAARYFFPQSYTFFHCGDILRIEYSVIRAVLRTTPHQLIHSHKKFHEVPDVAQGTGLVGRGSGVIVQWKIQPQRVGDFLQGKGGLMNQDGSSRW